MPIVTEAPNTALLRLQSLEAAAAMRRPSPKKRVRETILSKKKYKS